MIDLSRARRSGIELNKLYAGILDLSGLLLCICEINIDQSID